MTKNLLSQNGVSYEKSLLQLKTDEHVEEYELNQGKRIIHPDEITEEMANIFFSRFWGRQDVYAKRSINTKLFNEESARNLDGNLKKLI